MPSQTRKLPAEDRRQAILVAASPVFARLGVNATTKEIARAAGVSEALLYRHFSSKDALYAALEQHCVEAGDLGERFVANAEPSTATLVRGVAMLVQAVFPGIGPEHNHDDTKRLVTASLLGDGRLAKAFLERHVEPWMEVFEKSLRAARAAGDMESGISAGKAEIWFVHHLANTLHLISLPQEQVVDYGMCRDELVEATVRFLLRGLGLSSAAIEKHYQPRKLEQLFMRMDQE